MGFVELLGNTAWVLKLCILRNGVRFSLIVGLSQYRHP